MTCVVAMRAPTDALTTKKPNSTKRTALKGASTSLRILMSASCGLLRTAFVLEDLYAG